MQQMKWWEIYNFEKKPKLLSKRKVKGVIHNIYLSDEHYQASSLPYRLGILIGEGHWHSPFRNAIVAHELGHIHLGHTEWSLDRMLSHQLSRDKQLKEAIQTEIEADTWAVENTKFGQELLEVLGYYKESVLEKKEIKARIKNLQKLLKKKEKKKC